MSYEGRRNYNGNQQICGVGWRFPVGKLLFFFVFQFAFSFSFFFGFRCDVESENLTTITACQLRPCQSGSGFFSFFFFVCFFSLEGFFFFLFFFLSFSSFSYSDWRNVGLTVAVRGRKNVEIKVRQHQHGRFELMERSKKKEIASKSKSTAADNSTKKTRRNFPTALPTSSGRRWPYRRGWCCCCCWCCFCCCQAVTHSLCSRRSEEEEPPRAEDFSGRSATLHVFPSPHLACSVSITFRPISARYHHRFFFFSSQFPFCFVFFWVFFWLDRPTEFHWRQSPLTGLVLPGFGSIFGFHLAFFYPVKLGKTR